MTKEEAKEAIKEAYGTSEYTDEIIKALSAEPQGDSISREAVLNTLDNIDKALDEDRTVEAYKDLLKECFKELPPVEPQGFEDYLKQYLGENDQMIIGKDVYEELKYELETLKKSAEPQEWIPIKTRPLTKEEKEQPSHPSRIKVSNSTLSRLSVTNTSSPSSGNGQSYMNVTESSL